MPENYKKTINNSIEDIPDTKLEGGSGSNPIHKDVNMRLDNQGIFTKDDKKYYNFQVQVNKGCQHKTLAKMAPDSVAMCHAPVEDPWTGEQVRQALLATITGLPI